MAQQYEVHPGQITAWKLQLAESVANVFGKSPSRDKGADVKKLHTKIGQLTIENDFLEGARTKAGRLNAKY